MKPSTSILDLNNTMDINFEWLETDGLGGFAMGTAFGIPTRKYHSLLTVTTSPQTERITLVNGVEATLFANGKTYPLNSFKFESGVINPHGINYIESFSAEHLPTWTYRFENKLSVTCEMFMPHERRTAVIIWKLHGSAKDCRLQVRPFLSGRSYHALQSANPHLSFDAVADGETVRWQTYPDLPAVAAVSNGKYKHDPLWYYNFLYEIERDRGYPFLEDLASPGTFEFDLADGDAVLTFSASDTLGDSSPTDSLISEIAPKLKSAELKRRKKLGNALERAADCYLVRRGERKTIIAGYPWFSDWGRDAFIAMRGLCLATGRFEEAKEMLLNWGPAIKRGLVPNRFPDQGEMPDYNSVDASLWYIVAAWDYLQMSGDGKKSASRTKKLICSYIKSILDEFRKGTLFHIHCDKDGLLSAGQSGVQLTWMDAKIGDWVVTPRIGKPVEIQALWLNALKIGSYLLADKDLSDLFEKGLASFKARFVAPGVGYLYDVVDVNHQIGVVDLSFRPNQIFAIGGLPFSVLEGEIARKVVNAVEDRLFTPNGLRSLAPGEKRYVGHYQGATFERDASYHQGTAWAWLLGPFVEAWVRVRNSSPGVKAEARRKFVDPIVTRLLKEGSGHLFEIADGDSPHAPRGCPCQAWSVGELIRLDKVVLKD